MSHVFKFSLKWQHCPLFWSQWDLNVKCTILLYQSLPLPVKPFQYKLNLPGHAAPVINHMLLCYSEPVLHKMFPLMWCNRAGIFIGVEIRLTILWRFLPTGKRRYNIKLWKTFTDCFNCLPVAAIVDEKIFCCHGGIFITHAHNFIWIYPDCVHTIPTVLSLST